MAKNKHRALKLPKPIVYMMVAVLGFAAGYEAHGYLPTLKPHKQVESPHPGLPPSLSVCFTPGKQCQRLLLEQISKAKESVFMQAYSFTDPEVATALVNAAKRGVKVQAILDKSNARNNRSAKGIIMGHSISTRFDHPPGIAHSKVMVIDRETIVTGSYNFSASAYKRNVENLLVIHDKPLAQEYLKNWQARWELSRLKAGN